MLWTVGVLKTQWLVSTAWHHINESLRINHPKSDRIGQWIYPRPGATVSLSDCTGESPSSIGGGGNISSCSEVPNKI